VQQADVAGRFKQQRNTLTLGEML